MIQGYRLQECTVAEPIYLANQVPPRRVGHRGRFGMDALARHYVGQGNTRGEHSDPHFTMLGLGAFLFDHPKCVGPTVVSDDDARVFHGLISLLAAPQCAPCSNPTTPWPPTFVRTSSPRAR